MGAPEGPGIEVPPLLATIRSRVDEVLERFLADERASLAREHEAFLPLFDEIVRMVGAGGKRLRPMFCWLAYLAGGGKDEAAIAKVAAGVELFHTFALVHDDVMDGATSRRGAPTVHVRMAGERGGEADAERFGTSAAILSGDLAMVLADHLFLHSGFPPDRLLAAFGRYNRMRVEVAVGQFLDIAGSAKQVEEEEALRISALKSGSYTVEGPLHIGAILAGAGPDVLDVLTRYGAPLGEAFQLQNDLEDALHGRLDLAQGRPTVLLARARDGSTPEERTFLEERVGTGSFSEEERTRALSILSRSGAIAAVERLVRELVDEALGGLGGGPIPEEPADALRALAALVGSPVPAAARP